MSGTDPAGAKHFRWDYKQQPPMGEIIAAVAELSGGKVSMMMPFGDSDEYELVVSHGNGERPPVFARFLRLFEPERPDHDIAECWRYAAASEVTFWREIEAAIGGDL